MPILITLLLLFAAQDHPDKASPFDGLRWTEDGAPEVDVGGTWYRPVAIDDVEVSAIVEFCRKRWPSQLKKRFAEDLVEAMATMGHAPGPTVTLRLVPVGADDEITLTDVANTLAKRTALRNAGRPATRPPPRRSELTREQALADLAAFEAGLIDQFAYLGLADVDLAAEVARIADDLTEPVDVPAFARDLDRLMKRFGDGHASVVSPVKDGRAATGHLPILLADSSAGVVAFPGDRSRFLDADHPLVVTLDGEPLQDWLDTAAVDVAAGSPQLVRFRALRSLRDIAERRRLRGLPTDGDVVLGLSSLDGTSTVEQSLRLARRRPVYGAWPRRTSGVLDGNVGYLRLPFMDNASVDHVKVVMPRLADTDGLVVDVRGNGGGSRQALLTLAGYLIGPDEPPVVANIAAYRLSDQFDRDHLEARFMHRADDARWTAAQRAAIEAASASFEPEWPLPEGYSAWHYLVLDRTGEQGEFFYDRPVVVLGDTGCFSATDIFLGALTLLPRVTLVGQPSSGGSARSQRFHLPNSRIRVQCASMASFRPDGRLYDGRGIEMDVEVEPEPSDLLEGGGDAQLDAALAQLAGQRPARETR